MCDLYFAIHNFVSLLVQAQERQEANARLLSHGGGVPEKKVGSLPVLHSDVHNSTLVETQNNIYRRTAQ